MRDDYVPNLKIPAKKGPSRHMWMTILLCVILPPVGLILLWGGARCRLRGKICISVVSVIVMIVVTTLFLERNSETIMPPQPPVMYTYGQESFADQEDAVEAPPAADALDAADTAVQTGTPETASALPDGVIPANPMG